MSGLLLENAADCGAGVEGAPGFQPGNTCGALEGGFAKAVYDKEAKQWRMSDGSELPSHIPKNIPPAWTDVEISNDPDADMLVKGKDAAGRTQRRYSEAHVQRQKAAKFDRIRELNSKLGGIRKEIDEGVEAGEEAAVVAKLIDDTGIRPGSNKDTKAAKKAYGATTLENRHIVVNGDNVRLKFTGKKGVDLSIKVNDPDVKFFLKQSKESGKANDRVFKTSASKLNSYFDDLDGGSFTPKDFRTRKGTELAERFVSERKRKPKTMKDYKKRVRDVANRVSKELGNTTTVALQSYIDPRVFEGIKPVTVNAAGCGANAPGGGGFQKGNTCAAGAKGGRTTVEWFVDDELIELARKEFGGDEGIARLAGVPDDTNGTARVVDVYDRKSDFLGNDLQVEVKIEGESYKGTRIIHNDESLGKYIANRTFEVVEGSQGQSIGTKMIATQVEEAGKQGFNSIEALASGTSGAKGYYAWPRVGFDGKVRDHVLENAPDKYKSFLKVSDFMKTKEGRSWWKKNGDSIDVEFDPTPGSDNHKVLDAYLKHKGITLNEESDDGELVPFEPEITEEDEKVLDKVWREITDNAECGAGVDGSPGFQPGNICGSLKGGGKSFTRVRNLGGSTGAVLVKDDAGEKFVLKQGNHPDHIRDEFHANEMYRAAGVRVPDSYLREKNGQPEQVAEFVEGTPLGETRGTRRSMAEDALRKDFATDALLANWDVVGLDEDNVIVGSEGEVYRIDNGGSLRYRAQGASKRAAWGSTVVEIDSMRERGTAGDIFGDLSDSEVAGQINSLYKKRGKILDAVPSDLRSTMDDRLDYMKDWADETLQSNAECGAGVKGSPGFQPGNICGSLKGGSDKLLKNALAHYQGVGYKSMNKSLRQGSEPSVRDDSAMVVIDEALDRSSVQDVNVYRGGSRTMLRELLKRNGASLPVHSVDDILNDPELKTDITIELHSMIGDRFTDKGYVSTSKDKRAALIFSNTAFGPDNVASAAPVFNIIGKSKALNVLESGGLDRGESEVLLPRNTTFEIKDVYFTKSKYTVPTGFGLASEGTVDTGLNIGMDLEIVN